MCVLACLFHKIHIKIKGTLKLIKSTCWTDSLFGFYRENLFFIIITTKTPGLAELLCFNDPCLPVKCKCIRYLQLTFLDCWYIEYETDILGKWCYDGLIFFFFKSNPDPYSSVLNQMWKFISLKNRINLKVNKCVQKFWVQNSRILESGGKGRFFIFKDFIEKWNILKSFAFSFIHITILVFI